MLHSHHQPQDTEDTIDSSACVGPGAHQHGPEGGRLHDDSLGGRIGIDPLPIEAALLDGTPIRIRPIRPDDENLMRDAINALSPQSRYWRFFSSRPVPPDAVIHQLLAVDGHQHIAWGATLANDDSAPAIGSVHVFRNKTDISTGELSFIVADAWQGLGLVRMLLVAALVECLHNGIMKLDVQVLSENRAAIRLVHFLGGRMSSVQSGVSVYEIATRSAVDQLRGHAEHTGVASVFSALNCVSLR
jgi:RimJ/RimL family protein N-acetyltransferase